MVDYHSRATVKKKKILKQIYEVYRSHFTAWFSYMVLVLITFN